MDQNSIGCPLYWEEKKNLTRMEKLKAFNLKVFNAISFPALSLSTGVISQNCFTFNARSSSKFALEKKSYNRILYNWGSYLLIDRVCYANFF